MPTEIEIMTGRVYLVYDATKTALLNKLYYGYEAYSVDSGCSTCSVLSGGNLAATRNFFDGSGPFACAIPEGLL